MARDMPHKFKIGEIVSYRPVGRLVSAPRGTYIVTGLKPALDGQPSEYLIRHPGEDFERVALENELSASEPEHGQR
jgi:hypothetical protein